jgi:hypothetical protein
MTLSKYPPRFWMLVGYPGSGKSTFAAKMKGPFVVIDADHRFTEVLRHAQGDVYPVSDIPSEHSDPHASARRLNENMPGIRVGTIIVDSLTAIIAPRVTQAIVEKQQGEVSNLYAAFKDKALAMRQLQDAVTKWSCDTLWIYHLDDARDASGKLHTKATISTTELARLMRSVNLKLEVVLDEKKGKRGINVKWARSGRWGDQVGVLWDESGDWRGMPERIEAAVYDGLTQADRDAIESALPEIFPDDETAIAWGLEQGAFQALQHSRNAYEKLMRENEDPANMEERTALWVGDVLARLEVIKQGGANGNGHGNHSSAPATGNAPITHNEFWTRVKELGMKANAQPFIKANTIDGKTDWAGALRDLEAKAKAVAV